MLKLMVAEDEALERKALKYLVDKHFPGDIDTIYEAVNGIEAIELAAKHKPDIILMDISMPLMDGLEAAKAIKKDNSNIEFVIITAYGYFKYAKEAINIGINDYLLKPIANDEFLECMTELIDKVKQKKRRTNQIVQLKRKYSKLMPVLEREMIMQVIYKDITTIKTYEEYFDILGIREDSFACILVRSKVKGDVSKYYGQIKKRLSYYCSNVIGNIYINDFVFIVFGKGLTNKALEDMISSILKVADLNRFFNYSSSNVYTEAQHIGLVYEEAKDMMCKLVCSSEKRDTYPYDKEKQLIKTIINEGTEDIHDEIKDIVYMVFDSENQSLLTTKKRLHELVLVVSRNIIYYLGEENNALVMDTLEDELEAIEDVKDLTYHVAGVIKQMIESVKNNNLDKNIKNINEVKRYIDNNYMKNISLEEVSAYIGLSSYYLSKLFKKVDGINFKDYLTRVRMEKAKELLKESDLSIKEIAFEIGYTDPNYFSRVFKKVVGQSATRFAKK